MWRENEMVGRDLTQPNLAIQTSKPNLTMANYITFSLKIQPPPLSPKPPLILLDRFGTNKIYMLDTTKYIKIPVKRTSYSYFENYYLDQTKSEC